ncbi:unnamed protein product [Orchesella dallaii]|uniref:Uncharacterized protein n=1 Tax=Orchesella dallaii TaxID=48710 RepID=A0ABP1PVL5_9HEXA
MPQYIPNCIEAFVRAAPPAHQNHHKIYQESGNVLALVKPNVNSQRETPPVIISRHRQPSPLSSFFESPPPPPQLPSSIQKPQPNSYGFSSSSTWKNQGTELVIQPHNNRVQQQFTFGRTQQPFHCPSFQESQPQHYPSHQPAHELVYPHVTNSNPGRGIQPRQNQAPEFGNERQKFIEQQCSSSRRFQKTEEKAERNDRELERTTFQAVADQTESVFLGTQANDLLDLRTANNDTSLNIPSTNDAVQRFLEELVELRTNPLSADEYLEMVDLVNGELVPFHATGHQSSLRRRNIHRSERLKRFYMRVHLKRFTQKLNALEFRSILYYELKHRFGSQKRKLEGIDSEEFRVYFVGVIDEQSLKTKAASAIFAKVGKPFVVRSNVE